MTDDLVQRLRSNRPIPTLPHEAADRIEALEEDIERLRERVKRVENNNRKLRGSKERVYAATDLRQPTQADMDAMESILWVDTIIDDKEAIAKAFARHHQHGYDQGYYEGCANPIVRHDALREALEAAPLINLWESKEDFRRRQDGWLKTKYRAALEQSK